MRHPRITIFCHLVLMACSGYGQDCCVCLDFETAWERVIQKAPSLAAVSLEIAARNGDVIQAGLMPNPVLEIEGENLGVSKKSHHAEPPQTTVSLSQLIELGGKRRARFALATCEKNVACWEACIERQDRKLELASLFIAVSAAQEKWQIAQMKRSIAEQICECLQLQVQCSKSSPIQEKKAQIALKAACLEEREALAVFEESKKQLSLMWGSPCPDFEFVAFDFYTFTCPPCADELLEGLCLTPDYARAQQEVRCASRALRLERANAIPDVVLTAGWRYYNEAHAHGWVVAAQIPIPIFNFNQGGIQRACSKLGQANFLLEESLRLLREEMTVAQEHLLVSYDASLMIQSGVLCDAQEIFNLTQEGYQCGKLDYLELLDAQKVLFEIQEKYIEVLTDYHLHRAEIARLTGEFNE